MIRKMLKSKIKWTGIILFVFWAMLMSCQKDQSLTSHDLRTQKLSYYADSVRLHDSLSLENAAGQVIYTVQVVSGSSSSLYGGRVANGRTSRTSSIVSGARVTVVNSFGKKVSDSTNSSGIASFTGLLRGAISVSISKSGYTDVNYITVVPSGVLTPTSTTTTLGNIIPVFEISGDNTATLTGVATIETDLTNLTREKIPDSPGTTVTASIDATDTTLFNRLFLNGNTKSPYFPYIGHILKASFGTLATAKIASGAYTLTVPASPDGLPIKVYYSDFAGDQKVFETGSGSGGSFNQMVVHRNLFGAKIAPTTIPPAAGVNVTFDGGSGATATAVLGTATGTIQSIVVTDGGSGYTGTPAVQINDSNGGTGATAVANVTNGEVTSITLTNPGSGYVTPGTVSVLIVTGSGAAANNATLNSSNQSVFSISVTNGGTGYTSAPTVTFTGGAGSGATATAIISNGAVVSVTVNSNGTGFTSPPIIGFTGGAGSGATATANMASPVAQVTISNAGGNYVYAPKVIFDPPFYLNGTTATGTAIVDPNTQTVTGIVITNSGSGYISQPSVNLISVTNLATASAVLSGASVISAVVSSPGANYTGAPTLTFTGGGGQGAAGTATITNGVVTSITITNGGGGYTSAPTVKVNDPSGAQGFAVVSNGVIQTIQVVNGGYSYTAAPTVKIIPTLGGPGAGAVAAATVSGGQITGVTVTNGGTGYLGGNFPGSSQVFNVTIGATSADGSNKFMATPGKTIVNDVYYGTGAKQF